jgi:uncharacterized protein
MDVFEVDSWDEEKKIKPVEIVPYFQLPRIPTVQMLVFEVTHHCQLRCSYCFLSHFYPKDETPAMSLEVAQKAVRSLIDLKTLQQGKRFSFGFFGGEPLIAFQNLRDITLWCEGYFNGFQLNKSVTTNACAVDEQKARFFKEHGFSFIVSLDGPEELHNRFRKTPSGTGSFDQTLRGLVTLSEAGNRGITLRSTYLPVETKILERVMFLNELCDKGYGNWVSVEPACLTESRCIAHVPGQIVFTEANTPPLIDEYLSVADWFIEKVKEGKLPRIHVINKTIERLLWHLHSISECGGGVGYMAVNPKGEIYSCHREINSKIGDLKTGFDPVAKNLWCDNRHYVRPTCCSCPIKWVCGGGCREVSLGATGDINTPDVVSCLFKKIFFDAAIWVLANCSRDDLMKVVPNPVRNVSQKVPERKGTENSKNCTR